MVRAPRNWLLLVAVLVGAWLFSSWAVRSMLATPGLSYSEFRQMVAAGQVSEASVSPTTVQGVKKDGTRFETVRVEDPGLLAELQARGVKVSGRTEGGGWSEIFWVLPLLLFGWLFLQRDPGRGLTAVGKNRARLYLEKQVAVSFADVAGVDEAKEELQEVIEFLRHPEKFRRLGGKIPKGVLLVGPPGTGKTLLARAVAGEAGVPFLSISGSEFVEMFVGVGAARVRDLFRQARALAPSIIFIDELDAMGKSRGGSPVANEEREQTLNQLLVELDGFDPRVGVILMAATNRPEILDPALLRAGRFDRQILVDRPDRLGRLAILRLYARTVVLAADVDLEMVAGMTAGMAGADLANLINEAALLAARREKDSVGKAELQEALERTIAGLEKRNRVLNAREKERVAHHEVGHALVALSLPGAEQVQKISIIPRGVSALGYTLQLPSEDRFLVTQSELETRIAVLLGGRVAEELIFGEVSTGAQDDLLKATQLARTMVTAYGMSPLLGQASFEPPGPAQWMGGRPESYSAEVGRDIDREVRRILGEQHERVLRMLRPRADELRAGARALLLQETLSGAELLKAFAEARPAQPAALAG
ncbi:MAG TPA: ATP-dependent zinc metalloprotease FtsH [Myxococcales bacterium]|nr:ATP-dependent zinc metalloprotease FtsH [Myxococcales bacterium]